MFDVYNDNTVKKITRAVAACGGRGSRRGPFPNFPPRLWIPDNGLMELRNGGEDVDITLKFVYFQGGGAFRATLENIRNSLCFQGLREVRQRHRSNGT